MSNYFSILAGYQHIADRIQEEEEEKKKLAKANEGLFKSVTRLSKQNKDDIANGTILKKQDLVNKLRMSVLNDKVIKFEGNVSYIDKEGQIRTLKAKNTFDILRQIDPHLKGLNDEDIRARLKDSYNEKNGATIEEADVIAYAPEIESSSSENFNKFAFQQMINSESSATVVSNRESSYYSCEGILKVCRLNLQAIEKNANKLFNPNSTAMGNQQWITNTVINVLGKESYESIFTEEEREQIDQFKSLYLDSSAEDKWNIIKKNKALQKYLLVNLALQDYVYENPEILITKVWGMDIKTFNGVAKQLDREQQAVYMKALHVAPSLFKDVKQKDIILLTNYIKGNIKAKGITLSNGEQDIKAVLNKEYWIIQNMIKPTLAYYKQQGINIQLSTLIRGLPILNSHTKQLTKKRSKIVKQANETEEQFRKRRAEQLTENLLKQSKIIKSFIKYKKEGRLKSDRQIALNSVVYDVYYPQPNPKTNNYDYIVLHKKGNKQNNEDDKFIYVDSIEHLINTSGN